MTAEAKRTYILNMKDGTKTKISVPSKWKLTFGPLVPGSKDYNQNSSSALVLRIYEGNKDNQRAVFTGVESWRDTADLTIEVQQIETRQQTIQVEVPGEGARDMAVEAKTSRWVDPDATVQPRAEFRQLPQP